MIRKKVKIQPKKDPRGGFTLIEMVLVLTMMGSVIFVVASFRGNLDIVENLLNQKLQSRQDLEGTMQIVTTEMRSAGPSSVGAYAIESVASSSFVFYSDIDKDGLFERVRYFLYGTSTIQKGVTRPSGNPLTYTTSTETVTNVVNNVVVSTSTPIFAYYDEDYTGSQAALTAPIDPTEVRLLKITVYADINPEKSPIPALFTNTINFRNLRSN